MWTPLQGLAYNTVAISQMGTPNHHHHHHLVHHTPLTSCCPHHPFPTACTLPLGFWLWHLEQFFFSFFPILLIATLSVTSWNFDTILCIFSLDLCLPLYLDRNISMIYDYFYI